MNFSRFLDIQSWWEVPSIAYFCSLFRTAFNLLDFDIEELEEALLTDGPDHSGKSLLTELIVRLLKGSLGYHDISAFNYQMYLRRLFRKKCQNTGRYNPFNTDIDFQFLPLRTKVEILYALCDFRLDAEDVFDLFKNLEAESLRVEPLGWDDNDSAYWYFYGTRLYREDIKRPGKSKKKKSNRRRSWFYGDDYLQDTTTERVWQVVCFTEEDWTNLTEKFRKATSKAEKELYRSLSINFLPEIPRLFQEKERQQRKRLLEVTPRRTSSRVQKIRREREEKAGVHDATQEPPANEEDPREVRARRRNLLRHTRGQKKRRAAQPGSSSRSRPADQGCSSSVAAPRRSKSSDSDTSSESEKEQGAEAEAEAEAETVAEAEAGEGGEEEEEMPQKSTKAKGKEKRTKSAKQKEPPPPPPPPPVRTGRKTNNSLACATGQIVIPDNDEPVNSTRRKIKTSQIFSQTEEDVQTDMYKVLEQLTSHEDAWPFMDPVEEEYAPNYYAVIRRPMDLHKMEERLDSGYYRDFSMFKEDFKLIVNNCRLYNGQDNEYTTMVDNLQVAFDRLTEKYIHRPSSSDEEIAVEYQLPTPSRKHKLKRDAESPPRHKRKKRRIETIGDLVKMKPSERDRILASLDRDDDTDDMGVKVPDTEPEDDEPMQETPKEAPEAPEDVEMQSEEQQEERTQEVDDENMETEDKKTKESHKHKDKEGKLKKKRKGHHRHGKHSKNHKKEHKSGKRKHSKKRGKKDADGKRERRKKKKSKHQEEPEAPVVEEEKVKRSPSPESIESSNRSRSASPLPSIHTPSPSPEPVEEPPRPEPEPEPSDLLSDPEFLKDKYDKIKERRRHAAKDAFESLLEYKQKVAENKKHNLDIQHKDKNQKLKETIEKLKAKNRKISFNTMFTPGRSGLRRSRTSSTKTTKDFKDSDDDTSEKDDEEEKEKDEVHEEDEDDEEEVIVKKKRRKGGKRVKKSSAKNASASVALEQAVKDISKWLEEAPKGSALSSPCDSPAQTISTEDHDSSRLDDESSQGERSLLSRRDAARKRNRIIKRREIQRTIERLQPGKSKGNLLTNIAKNIEKTEEDLATCSKVDLSREESSPKLSLGSVLPTVEFTLGDEHKFTNKEEHKALVHTEPAKPVEVTKEVKDEQTSTEELPAPKVIPNKKDAEVETEPQLSLNKPSQEKATPNLSAWFKAFGAPKSSPSTAPKKKPEETDNEEKPVEASATTKPATAQAAAKIDSPITPGTPTAEGGDSPLPSVNITRQRRTSTGSSVSERSSFSQDLDSPRHQMSHNSPLLRSPASPRTEDFQKITYPIINGSVRAGFYQDTTSTKSPDKGCSPREGPQSPYSAYSQHVYALNSATGSGTPNYFVDNKSPLPTYGQNAPPYYDSSKVQMISKPPRAHEDYVAPNQEYLQPYAPYSQPSSNLPPPPPPPPPPATSQAPPVVQPPTSTPQVLPDPKAALFPVKKRTYSEPEPQPAKSTAETKTPLQSPAKNDYPKPSHAPLPPLSVDDIALALSEKSEIAKISSLREKNVEYTERNTPENLTNTETAPEPKKDTVDTSKSVNLNKKDNIDMVNMGYMNTTEAHEIDYSTRDVTKSNVNQLLRKGYEMEAGAINLGVSNPQHHKPMPKPINTTPNMTPAHSHETTIPRASIHTDLVNQNLAHVHHNQYDSLSSMQSISNFSLNDIELANKKLFAGNTAPAATAIDYGNWKMTNPMRKQDMLPSDYATNYSTNNDDKKAEVSSASSSAINYNKSTHSQPYSNYNSMPRSRPQEIQQNVPAELRIPNPRGLLKADAIIASSAINDPDTIAKNMEAHAKSQKTDKAANSPIPYKSSYTTMSSLPIDTLRNLPHYPRMLDRYRNDERYLSSFPASPAMYHDKAYQMAELFNKAMPTPEAHGTSISYSQPSQPPKESAYKTPSTSTSSQPEPKPKTKRKRTAESKPAQVVGNQQYHAASCSGDILSSVKQGMMPASAFNVGSTMNMALGGMYADNGGYALVDDFRNSTNQLMAANYMAAAVAHQQRSSEATEKLAKPAHQNSNHSGSFSFIGPQVRAGYPFVGADPSSPLYQQYLQRYQEELQRQTGAQIMGLYAPPYAPSLSARQPYDAINRPAWL